MFDLPTPVPYETHDDDLGCARGLIYWTPVSLLLWGVILGALMWVL